MTDEKDIIDYGSITVPTSWNDITLKVFQDIERYYNDKDRQFNVIDVLDIFIDKDKDYIMSLPSEFLEKIMEKLSFLQTQPEVGEPSNSIVISGETYSVNVMEKLKTGEYIAFDGALKNDKYDYASFLAILCRKKGEVYDSKFEAEVFEERRKMFEQLPVVKVLPTVSFFLQLWLLSETPSLLYTKVEEALDLTAQSIANSDKIGAFKKLYLKSRIKTLRKSLMSNKNT